MKQGDRSDIIMSYGRRENMDWMTGIQRAIDYVEAHLDETADYGAVAREAASSPFHFQRMFAMVCGYTFGDYIRMRRLSVAADELYRTDDRIIDIALRSGYDTPESFSRAFTRFHGISPSEARHGGNVKSFSRLSVKLILEGGNIMDYRIEKADAFKVICRRKRVEKPQGDLATDDISGFWRECTEDGTVEKICGYADFDRFHGILGICFSGEMADNGFPYGIGAEYNGTKVAEDGFDIVEIPAHTYAVFTCRGRMPDAFRETYRRICTEFFPQNTAYEYGSGVELEVYPSADVQNPDYTCEIWIAVKEKKN